MLQREPAHTVLPQRHDTLMQTMNDTEGDERGERLADRTAGAGADDAVRGAQDVLDALEKHVVGHVIELRGGGNHAGQP
eukprot:6248073-Prymnesium_polylepis.1